MLTQKQQTMLELKPKNAFPLSYPPYLQPLNPKLKTIFLQKWLLYQILKSVSNHYQHNSTHMAGKTAYSARPMTTNTRPLFFKTYVTFFPLHGKIISYNYSLMKLTALLIKKLVCEKIRGFFFFTQKNPWLPTKRMWKITQKSQFLILPLHSMQQHLLTPTIAVEMPPLSNYKNAKQKTPTKYSFCLVFRATSNNDVDRIRSHVLGTQKRWLTHTSVTVSSKCEKKNTSRKVGLKKKDTQKMWLSLDSVDSKEIFL